MKRRVLAGIATGLVVALVAVVAFALFASRPGTLPSAEASVPAVSLQPGRVSTQVLKAAKSSPGTALPGPKSGVPLRAARLQPVPASVTLRYAAGISDATKRALASSLGLRVTHEFPGGWTVVESTRPGETSVSLAESIKASGAVAVAAPTPRVTPTAIPNDPEFASQWDLRNTGQQVGGTFGTAGADIGWIGAWNRASTGAGVIVAVTDTGADFQHEDLASQMWANPTPGSDVRYAGDVRGWNWVEHTGLTFQPWDGDEHGTHVSGTIAAATNNGVGIAGIASGARIMSLKFIGPSSGSEDDAAAAVYYAVAHGARVINASWGDATYSGPYQPLRDAIHAAAQQGVLFVAAAGNNNRSDLFYPAAYSLVETNVIAVAATDNRDGFATFSNYGTYPQLAAPGVNTPSTYPPLQAGVFVDKAPFRVSYLTFPVEAIVSIADRDGVVGSAMGALTSDKSAPVLVVDDSRVDLTGETQGVRLQPYLSALAADGYSDVTTWVTATQGVPSAATMSGHTVVWFTGMLDSASYNFPGVGTLDAADRAQVSSFLDGGGRLFLSSASVAWDLTTGTGTTIADSAWLAKYLRVDLVSNALVAVAKGRPETSFAGLSPVLSDPLINISYCDAVLPADTVAVRTMDWAGSGYGAMSGTSMAAPHVTGVVALVTQRFPGITAQQVKDRILATVKLLPSLTGKVTTGGRLDASAALAPYGAQVTAFSGASSLDGTITLAWTNPADLAWERTVIRGREGADPTGPADASSRLVYSGTGATINDIGLPGGTQMHYMAYTHSTTGLWSDGVPVIVTALSPPPGPVTGLMGSSSVAGVHLSWFNPIGSFTGARIVRSTIATPTSPTDGTVLGDTAGSTFDDPSAIPGVTATTYHYAVFAHDAVPAYSARAAVDVLVPKDAVPPAAPGGVSALAGDQRIALSWSNPADTDFVLTRVLRSTVGFATDPTPSGNQVVAYSGPGTSLADNPLTNGTRYFYTLFSQDAAGNWSQRATAAATPVPDPVTGATGVWLGGTGVVHLTWTNPTGSFTGVQIVRSTTAIPTSPTDGTVLGDTAGSTFDDTSVIPGAADTTYHYALFAHDGTPVYASGVAVDVLVPADTVPPGPVTKLGVTGVPGPTTVVLHWTNPTDLDFHEVRVLRSTVGFATFPYAVLPDQSLIGTVTTPGATFTDAGVAPATTYFYTLFARDAGHHTSVPATLSVTTVPTPVFQNVYRFYNLRAGVHFYTASDAEMVNVRDTLGGVYRFEGPSYVINLANANNTLPVYRFYNLRAGVHFYTASEAEKQKVLDTLGSVYRYEGIAYKVSQTSDNAFPVYRFYNFKAGVHFYTASDAEMKNVLNTLGGVYRYEGVAYYVGR